jgi:hypothetical protein
VRTDDDRHPIVGFRDEGIGARREHRKPWGRSWNLRRLQKTTE